MDIKQTVTDLLKDSGQNVKDQVVNTLFKAELDKRTDACLKVIEKITENEKAYKKANKPDIETFKEDGKVDTSGYSKAKVEELKKMREEKEKLDTALQNALEKNDFTKLLELAK
jgi:transcription termination factor NusB